MALATRPKPSAHERKRQAGHHRHDDRYLKTYWPYLPMLLIMGLGIFVSSLWSHTGVLGASSDFSTVSLLSDTNTQRVKDGETPLRLDNQLAAAAQAKADDMVRTNYWSHTSPSGKTPWAFISGSGYQYQGAGENLAYGFTSAGGDVAGWMNSAEHRANILNSTYQDVGFGVASSADYVGQGPQTVVVAEYAQPAGSTISGNSASSAAGGESGTTPSVLGAATTAQPVSRIQLLAGNQAAWSLLAVVAVSGAAMALFLLRHGYRAHRLLTQGETFVTRHPYLDITIVFIITAGGVLTRTGGIIR